MKVQLMGEMILSDRGGCSLTEEHLRSKKLTNLLAYLLVYRSKPVPQPKLAETVLESTVKNPENTLRNLIYRLRTELKMFGPEEYILTLPGAYQWNPDIPVETDYEWLEELETQLRNLHLDESEEAIEEKKTICERIIDVYNGNITERIANEPWMISRAARYQFLYLNAVLELCRIYEKERCWAEEEALCEKTLREDILDEDVSCKLILSIHRQGRTDEAIRCYEMAKKLFYERFGMQELKKLQDVFRQIITENRYMPRNFDFLRRDLREDESPRGVFFCDYQVFREVYRIEARRAERFKIREYVMLITLSRTDDVWKNTLTDSGLLQEMEYLEQVVYEQLRAGDVATRFGPTQFLVLLTGCSYENSLLVAERIEECFYKQKKKRMKLSFEFEEVHLPGEQAEQEKDGGQEGNYHGEES